MRTYMKRLSLTLFVLGLGTSGFGQSQSGFTASPASTGAPPSTANSEARPQGHDPLLDLPALPHNRITLMGGTVLSTDEVMNRMVFQPFGTTQKLQVHFDTRTRFFLDGKQITEREVKQGQRIYLDTMLNGDRVFAKTMWIRTTARSGIGRGQITAYDGGHKILTVRDELSNQPVKLQLTPSTSIRKGNQPASVNDLIRGSLVTMDFGPQRELRTISIVAAPGSTFVFAGRVSYVDMSQKLIAIDNRSDGKKYDVNMDAISANILRQLREGQEVSVSTVFDGTRYEARSIDFTSANSAPPNR